MCRGRSPLGCEERAGVRGWVSGASVGSASGSKSVLSFAKAAASRIYNGDSEACPGHLSASGRGGRSGAFGDEPIVKTVLQRLGLGLVTLFVVSIMIFSAVTLLPGDFATAILGQSATPETVAAFQRQIGLDRPPVLRYLFWIGGVLHGDFGEFF